VIARWEIRLLAVVVAVLCVVGLASVYGASSLQPSQGGQVGSAFALRQALGVLVGGLAATVIAPSTTGCGAPRRGRSSP
jgi:cell division protein FtsW (lipid II flippase)